MAGGGRIVALACWAFAVAWGGCLESDPPPPEPPVAVRADGFVSSRVAASLGQLSRAATTRGFTLDGDEDAP